MNIVGFRIGVTNRSVHRRAVVEGGMHEKGRRQGESESQSHGEGNRDEDGGVCCIRSIVQLDGRCQDRADVVRVAKSVEDGRH